MKQFNSRKLRFTPIVAVERILIQYGVEPVANGAPLCEPQQCSHFRGENLNPSLCTDHLSAARRAVLRQHRTAAPISVAVLTAIVGLFFNCGCAGSRTQPVASTTPAAATIAAQPPSQSLTGAELYAINCNRCHPERSPIERRSAEWKTILTHMRVRANLPAAQARLILQYLQDNSGS